MILICLVVSAIALFISFVYVARQTTRLTLTAIFGLMLIGSVAAISANDSQHLGMVKTTTTKTTALKSAGSSTQPQLLLYQSVGQADKHRVYVYKTTANQKKTQHTAANVKTTNRVKTTTATPKLVTKTTRWTYRSTAMRWWFGLANNDQQLVKRTHTFYVNSDWAVLSTTQAKQLAKLMKQHQAQLKTQAQSYVQQKVVAAKTSQPTISASELKQVSQKAASDFQAQAVQKFVQQVQSKN